MNYFLSKPLTIILSLFLFFQAYSQEFSYPENKDKDGLKLISSKQNSISLEFSIHEFEITSKILNGESVNNIQYGLNLIPGEEGTPELPFISKNLLIPNDAQVQLKIISDDTEMIEEIIVAPASKIPFDTEESIIAQKGDQYEINANFPAESIQYELTEIRGMDFIRLAINPFQYNPVTKELLVHKNIKFEIELTGGKSTYGENRFRSPYWDPILNDFTFNSSDIPKIDYNKRNNNSKDEGCEYLIVVPDNEDYMVWADTIRKFRNEQGIDTKIMTISELGGNDVSTINSFFEDVYDNWDPVPAAVLLMSDYGEDDEGITSIRFTHPYEGTYITDNFYADVTNNSLPDFVFARMTGNNYEELEILVNKFLSYERTPPTAENFYNEPITALGWQTERWFQICSETVGGYMSSVLGKTPVRINEIYEGNPNVDPWSTNDNTYMVMNYFGPDGLNYIPSSPTELGDWDGGSANDIVEAINSGCFILQHRDHGFYSGWGEPAFQSNHINQLNNIDQLTHVFSINCLTGQFDVDPGSFGEKFHRHPDGGAVSVTAPTQVSYSFVNDALVWGIYDNMWPDFMPDYGGSQIPERDFRPAFGLASGKYFLSTSNWPTSPMQTITYRLFHHHGDAFGNIYTEVPMENEVVHELGITSDVTNLEIEATDGSLVGLSVEGEFLASGIVDGTSVDLSFAQQEPGTQIKVVVTKQNYFRHESYVLVVPTEGPYVMKTSYSISDENGNNEVDYNEEISIDLVVKNVGLEEANNVELNLLLEDEFINITSGTYSIGSIAAGQEITIEDAFTFETMVEIPDLHQLEFVFQATDGNLEWESDLSLTAYAPHLVHSIISFEEIDGDGNAYLDPGETAIARFNSTNFGHRNFPAGTSSLSESSEYISINATTVDFEEIAPEASLIREFEITASESTPYASIVSVVNQITADPFSIENELFFTVGLILEDWETAATNEFEWQMSGDLDWFITDDYTAEGDYALKSGDIGDNEASVLSINYDVLSNHQISFYMQISSEEDKDFLNFYIDDELVQAWTGLVLFEEFIFPVEAGNHTFTWEYIKDEEDHSGLDAAWLDYIIFPPWNTILGTNEGLSSKEELISIYPNPANQQLFIRNINDYDFEIDVFNSMGQMVLSNFTGESIDLKSFEKGIYILKVKDKQNKKSQIIQFIKL
jgi:hypothetical protein